MFADQGFAGRLVDRAAITLHTTVEIGREPAEQRGFAVHPKRWVVERGPARLSRREHDRRRHSRPHRGRPATRRLINTPE